MRICLNEWKFIQVDESLETPKIISNKIVETLTSLQIIHYGNYLLKLLQGSKT